MRRACFVLAALMVFCALPVIADTSFNGHPVQRMVTAIHIITGGKFPTGNIHYG